MEVRNSLGGEVVFIDVEGSSRKGIPNPYAFAIRSVIIALTAVIYCDYHVGPYFGVNIR